LTFTVGIHDKYNLEIMNGECEHRQSRRQGLETQAPMMLRAIRDTDEVYTSNCSRNENVLKLPRHGVYDILKVKSQKKVGVTELVKKI
jgi:hypothetical protein